MEKKQNIETTYIYIYILNKRIGPLPPFKIKLTHIVYYNEQGTNNAACKDEY